MPVDDIVDTNSDDGWSLWSKPIRPTNMTFRSMITQYPSLKDCPAIPRLMGERDSAHELLHIINTIYEPKRNELITRMICSDIFDQAFTELSELPSEHAEKAVEKH